MRVGILGTGNMGKAIIAGLLKRYGDAARLFAWDARAEACQKLPSQVSCCEVEQWFASADAPQLVVVAVKPMDIAAALDQCVSLGSKETVSGL